MAAKIVKMESGTFAWHEAGIEGSGTVLEPLEKWQAYDWWLEDWVPAKDYMMWAFLKVGDFDNTLREIAEPFESDVTVYAYDSNECFGALRPQ